MATTNTRVAAPDVRSLDPYSFFAVVGKRVIHPGGRRSTPYVRKMAWLVPRVARAVPYLGYILVAGVKPAG